MAYISKITLPNGTTYDIKDEEARQLIAEIAAQGLSFIKSSSAENTPLGVTWENEGVLITGTLQPSADIHSIYLVPSKNTQGKDIYDEYICVNVGTESSSTYIWEKLGDTDIDFDSLGELAFKDNVNLNKSTDVALGNATTFTNSSSAVTFTGGASESFVKSYPGTTSKLETTTIKGVGSDTTFTTVDTNTAVTATNTVFGTATTASKIETESKTASNTVFGTDTTASKATAGTTLSLAKAASTATNVSYVGNSSTTSLLESARVDSATETLILGSVSVSQSSVTGTNGTENVTPYTFADVTVPVVTSNASVSISSVKTNTNVTVPVVTSNNSVTATNTTTTSTTAATSSANTITVATGSLDDTDATGATIMTGLGTAVISSAITNVGTGTAAAQTITVGNNDEITVLDNNTNITVS